MNVILKIQTLAMAYDDLASNRADFREAFGNFVDAFFLYAVDDRQRLLDEPIQVPLHPSVDQLGWAAFTAATAEHLTERYDLICPAWALEEKYYLQRSWYHPAARTYPKLRKDFRETAPEPFRKRNVFCSDRVFSNTHPSSKEPGNLEDRHHRLAEILASLPEEDRVQYLAAQTNKMARKPQIVIVA